MKESKETRFKRLVEARVNKITAMFRLLGNCSFKGNYEYEEEQINKIFDKLYSELDKVHQRFISAECGNRKFSLTNDYIRKENPSLIMPLPDGTCLRAVAAEDDTMPNLSIYLQTGNDDEEKSVCYAEYNYERGAGKELCIGVWNSQEEDPYFYEPFNKGNADD
ncbi:hypothetical protein [Bacteroides acidifaciens]|uniref:hypothetical protein n=1 Tax=Bacteroides acidifaciens TaxID=85831 RepID=UPI002557F4C5|nr:hypothetical protein [Bacteroides acidifaciens]